MKIAPSNAALLAENKRLKAELQAAREQVAPISIDPAKGELRIRNYQTDSFVIDSLDLQSPAITGLAQDMSRLEKWANANKRGQAPDLQALFTEKMTVSNLKMSLPFATINKLLPEVAGAEMAEAGVTQIAIGPGKRSNELAIRGRVNKIVDVGFSASGQVSMSASGKPKFNLGETKIAGFPMPNFLATLATAVFAGDKMKAAGVEQWGSQFSLDLSKFLPPNVEAPLTEITVDRKGISVSGGLTKKENLDKAGRISL